MRRFPFYDGAHRRDILVLVLVIILGFLALDYWTEVPHHIFFSR